ncbi:MAG: hypothetical protein OEY23_02530 [Acidimicrobiia bacterium]|nr:hypothetical protein [Acidimicrobiia bacterium]
MPSVTGFEVQRAQLPTQDAAGTNRAEGVVVVTLRTDDGNLRGHGLVACPPPALRLVSNVANLVGPATIGADVDALVTDPATVWKTLRRRPELRLIESETGWIRLARAAVLDALWDLAATAAGLPLWKLLADLSPARLAACVDFRDLSDALSPDGAVQLISQRVAGRAARESQLRRDGYPAAVFVAVDGGSEAVNRRVTTALQAGWSRLRIEVPRPIDEAVRVLDDVRRAAGANTTLQIQLGGGWEVEATATLARALVDRPGCWLVEPLTGSDAPNLGACRVDGGPELAAGAGSVSRIGAKHLLRGQAIDAFRLDAARLGGYDEAIAVLLLAARYRIPVWPSGTGPGAAERCAQLGALDHVAIGASLDARAADARSGGPQLVAHPAMAGAGRYTPALHPGSGSRLRDDVAARVGLRAGAGAVGSSSGEQQA